MLYDIIPVVEQSSGTVVVNSTAFLVDCAAISGLQQVPFDNLPESPETAYYTFTGSSINDWPVVVTPMRMLLPNVRVHQLILIDCQLRVCYKLLLRHLEPI